MTFKPVDPKDSKTWPPAYERVLLARQVQSDGNLLVSKGDIYVTDGYRVRSKASIGPSWFNGYDGRVFDVIGWAPCSFKVD